MIQILSRHTILPFVQVLSGIVSFTTISLPQFRKKNSHFSRIHLTFNSKPQSNKVKFFDLDSTSLNKLFGISRNTYLALYSVVNRQRVQLLDFISMIKWNRIWNRFNVKWESMALWYYAEHGVWNIHAEQTKLFRLWIFEIIQLHFIHKKSIYFW